MPPSPTHAASDTVELAARLRLAVTRLARQLRKTSDSDLSPTQGSLLATIAAHGPLTLGELAERERVASPTITKVVTHLHERALVTKTTDDTDRRFVLVALTDEGQRLLERSRAHKNAWLAERLRHANPADLEVLEAATEVLDRLTSGDTPS